MFSSIGNSEALGTFAGVTRRTCCWPACWHEQNRQQLRSRRRGIRSSKHALRRRWQQIHTSSQDRVTPNVNAKRADLKQARQTFGQLLSGLVDAIESRMTFSQRQAWATRRSNQELPMQLRSVGQIDRASREQLMEALKRGGAEDGSATMDALSYSQQTALQQARRNQKQHMADVISAERDVLPTPPPAEVDVGVDRRSSSSGG